MAEKRKIMKRILAMTLALIMCCAMCVSCGKTANHTSFNILADDFGAEEYAIGFRKEDVAFAKTVQRVLDKLYADGTAKEISEEWFGEDVILRDNDFPSELVDNPEDTSMAYILSKEEIVLGLDASFPPMGYTDDEGNIVGFDIDLAKAVCEELGIKLKLQPIDWNSKDMEIAAKNIDVIWNGFSVNEERIAEYTFSKPYLSNRQIIIVPDGSTITNKAQLEGKKVGLQAGSTALDAVNADAIASKIGEIVTYPDNLSAFLDLKAGRIDAFVVDYVVGKYILDEQAETEAK